MKKEKIKQILTSKVGVAVITGFIFFNIGGVMGTSISSDDESYKAEMEAQAIVSQNEISEAKSNLENIKNETQDFFNLDVEDRELAKQYMVDLKNKSNEEKIAEQERIKAEQEAKAQAEAEAKAQAEAEEKARLEAEEQARLEAERTKYNTGITFEDLARNPSENVLKLVTFSGKILQVMKGDGYNQYRMAVNSDYDKVILIEVQNELLSKGNILEDDVITIRGTFLIEQTYTTVMGAERTIPAIVVDEIDY